MSNLDQLFDRVEGALSGNLFGGDNQLPAAACLAFCDLIADQLDNEQRAGVEDARLYLSGTLSEELRLEANARLGRKLDEIHRSGDGKSKQEAIQRLAWSTLVVTEGMTPVMGEFLVGLGDRAGLTPNQMEEVFVRLLPGF